MKIKNLKIQAVVLIAVLAVLLTGGCGSKVNIPPLPKEDPVVTVTLYRPTKDGLIGVDKEIPKSKLSFKYVMQLLVREKGKEYNGSYKPFLSPGTKIINVDVDKKGLATVNFSREILNAYGSEKKMQIYGVAAIVKTLIQAKEIKSVQFEVEGRMKGWIGKGKKRKRIENWWGEVTLKEQPWK